MKNLTLAIFSVFSLVGCATEYSCGQFPSSGCQPISKVIDRTDDEVYDYREDLYKKTNKESGLLNGGDEDEDEDDEEEKSSRKLQNRTVLAPPKAGNPILKKPEVLRVFMPQWVDSDDNLNGSGYIYIKVKEASWSNL